MNTNQTDYDMLNIDSDILTKAWDGDAVAQLILGKTYSSVVYNENNCMNAFKWFLLSAEQGNMEAQFRLGDLYALGQGTKKSFVDAYGWYTKAALQGYKKALIRIHNLYQEDKKMHCRGQLNSDEEEWASDEFKKKNNIRELNEFRLEKQASTLNNAMDFYTDQFKFYKTSDQDDVEVQLYLAFSYQHGYGVEKYEPWALELYTKAAEQGHKDAQYNLGYLYQHNTDIKFNYRHALRWYRVSATKGNIAAQNCLGYFYEKGLTTELNYEGALYWYTQAAISGNSSAQLTLGRLYRKGQGVKQNTSEAVKWYKLAASQGNTVAQNCLNQLYLNGKLIEITETDTVSEHGIEPPTAFALRNKLQNDINRLCGLPGFKQLKELAHHALRTDRNAMYRIGLKYYNGEDLPFDNHIGFRWIKKSAKGGLEDAQLMIAKIHEKGGIVAQDFCESSKWYMKSVKKNNDKAQLNLGLLYKQGFGVRKDALEASKWFLKSSKQGNDDARYQLGLLKYHGEGVRKDYRIAHQWFLVAALNGNIEALCEIAKLVEKVGKLDFFSYSAEVEGSKIITTNWGKRIFKLYNILESSIDPITPVNTTSKDIASLIYKLAAKYNNRHAQFRLGEMYEVGEIYGEGDQIKQDQEKAHEYYTNAADSGDPVYQTELAIKYLNREFEDTDYTRAFDLLKKAADKNEPRASGVFQIPMDYKLNIKNYSNVIDMLTSASAKGIEGVDYTLGHIYEQGIHLKGQRIFDGDYEKSKSFYFLAAKKGDSRAQYRLGVIYEEGKGVDIDIQIAIECYNQAYRNGNCDAAYSLGLMYLNGKGVSQDLMKSFLLFNEASDMGHKKAYEALTPSYEKNSLSMLEAVANLGYVAIQYQLGVFYDNKDDLKSFKWLTSAAKSKISDAYYRLGILYEEGRGTSKDYSKAIEFYNQAVNKDLENAMYRLAHILHYGLAPEYNLVKAFELYTRAAKAGHRLSQKILNITGDHVSDIHEKDEDDLSITTFKHKEINNSLVSTSLAFEYSLKMYKHVVMNAESIKSNHVTEKEIIEAQYTIGLAYENTFSKPNYPEAAKWYTKAAKKSHEKSMYRLGLLYEKGLGVTQNYQKAVQLYKDSYKQGNYDALYRLAKAYHFGNGVNMNPEKAIQYYTEAANCEQVNAQYDLGIIYEQGELVVQNIYEALKWFNMAYLHENDKARYRLFSIYDDIPLEDYFHEKLYKILCRTLRYNNFWDYPRRHDDDTHGYLYYELGRLCLYGLGTQRDYKEAWEHITKPIEALKCKDKYCLLELNSIETVEMQSVQANEGNVEAQYSVGKYHFIQATQEQSTRNNRDITTTDNDGTESNDDSPISDHYRKALHYLSLAASNGHPGSQFYLGKIYQNGYGTAISYEKAKEWYTESSDRRYRGARHSLGMLYLNEPVPEIDYPEALLNFDKAAHEGDANSSFQLGWMYKHGIGVLKDKQEETSRLQSSIEIMRSNSNPDDIIEDLDNVSENTTDQNPDTNTLDDLSRHELQELSNNGNFEASYILSRRYLNGINVERNLSKSVNYLRIAARGGHVLSQEELALSYYYGTNVVNDIGMATMWFRAAVKKDSSISMLYLGQIHHCGLIDKPNFSEAFKLYKSVDETYDAHAIALQATGLLYEHGDVFKTNYKIALQCYNESFRKGNTFSGYNIALMYFHGKDVKQDYKESIYWLGKAIHKPAFKNVQYLFIETGSSQAEIIENQPEKKYSVISCDEFIGQVFYLLGRIYYEGLGVQQDADKSFGYFSEAVKKGKTEAKIQLNEIEEARRQSKKIEDDKLAKSKLEKMVENAMTKLTSIKKGKEKLLEFNNAKVNWIEIERIIQQLEQEIDETRLILNESDEDVPRSTREFEDTNLRLKETIEKATELSTSINEVILELIEANKCILLLSKIIEKAEVQVGKKKQQIQLKNEIRNAKLLLTSHGDKPLQKTVLDNAIARLKKQLMIP